jgi:hypothetical protein
VAVRTAMPETDTTPQHTINQNFNHNPQFD